MIYPSFVENRRFYALDSSQSEEMKLMNLAENFKKLQYLTTRHYQDFDQLILEYLKSGNEIFGMKIGIVSKIEGDEYLVCNVDTQEYEVKKGDIFSLEGTYCREVVNSNQVICFPHVGIIDEMKTHPVYENMKLESYISAPIYVKSKLYGTLNFSSTETRAFGFSEHERDFISIMADSIGSFLELSLKEEELKEANERLKKLVGFVAHDLRNPLGSIQTSIDLVKSGQPVNLDRIAEIIRLSAESALEIVHTILETAAMGTGKVELNVSSVNFSEMMTHKVLELEKLLEGKGINLVSHIKSDVVADVDENRIKQVLDNLSSNMVKYTPPGGHIEILLQENEEHQLTAIFKNTMSPHIASGNIDFDVTRSVGFGLEIIREILKLHHSKLHLNSKDNCFIASFSVH